MSKTPHIAVVIVNYNGGEWLNRCIESVAQQTYENFTCVIVDNASTDGSIEALPELDTRFVIKEMNDNMGFARGCNIGVEMATKAAPDTEWLAMLNPDAFARPNWLEKLLEAATLAPNVTMVGSKQIMALQPDTFDGLGDFYHVSGLAWRGGYGHKVAPTKTRQAFGPCGAGALYHYPTFARIGGYDERFFCYHEDVDIAYRMRLLGGICIQSSEAIIDHVSSGITGRASDFAVYHGTRNRIWTFYKNTPFPLILILMPVHIAMNFAMLFWSSIRAGLFKPTWRGIKDGFQRLPELRKSRRVFFNEHKTISTWDLLRSFAWSPRIVVKRGIPKMQSFSKSDKGGL